MFFPTVAAHPVPVRARAHASITGKSAPPPLSGPDQALHAGLLTPSVQNFLFNLFQTVQRGQSQNYWSTPPKCAVGVANANVYAFRRDRRAVERHRKAYRDVPIWVVGGGGECVVKEG